MGFVDDPAFFVLAPAVQRRLLKPYAWAEFYSPMDRVLPLRQLVGARFFQADTQIRFILNLKKVAAAPGIDALECRFADRTPFQVPPEAVAVFEHERFRHIAGCTTARINERYAIWANDLIREQPENCIQLFLKGRLQGWFLSRSANQPGLNLALAMLASTAEISGMLLYQQALAAYAERGHRLGGASFSVTNTQVHNIYAALGARFMPPGGNWLWLSDDLTRHRLEPTSHAGTDAPK